MIERPSFLLRGLLVLALVVSVTSARAAETVVFAAASLTDAFQDVANAWRQEGHGTVTLDFASSAVLARQIDQGAGAGLFASADLKWMDWAQQRGLIVPETRHDLLANSLVLVMAKAHAEPVAISPALDLAALLGPRGHLAVGDPASVPAGLYARQALETLHLWASVEPLLARAENVRAALLLVQTGEARAGIVYATDAMASPDVAIVGTFPPNSHEPIVYPVAVVRAGNTPEARALLTFLSSPRARAIFVARGFQVP